MAPWYRSDCVKLLLTLTVLLMLVILTASTKQYKSKKTERDGDAVRNVGIKLCQLKCAEQGQCGSLEDDIVILTCRLSGDESKTRKKKGHAILTRGYSHVQTVSCTCSSSQRCLKNRSGKEFCVEGIGSRNSVPPAPMTTHDLDPRAWTTDTSDDLTSSKTVPSTSVTTQDFDPHETSSQARGRDLYWASRNGELERVKRILAVGHVDINSRGLSNKTPLMMAAWWGYTDVVEFLVGRGADVSLVDRYGNNALHLPCQHGELETVKLILSLNKVDVNTRDNFGKTAADYARRSGRQQVLDLLVSRDAH